MRVKLKCGHFGKPYHRNLCRSCYGKEYYKENRTRILAREKQYRKDHLKRYKKRARKAQLKHKYNLTIKQYKKMLKKQKYKCAICKIKHTKKQKLQVDHNHKTGKIRGLLCRKDNLILG